MWNWSSRSYRLHSIEWASNWGWFTSLLESAEFLKWLHQSYPCRDEHFIRLWCWPDVSCLRVWCQIALVSRFRCISLFCFERWHFLPRGQRDARNPQRLLHFSPKGWTLRPHPFFEHFELRQCFLWEPSSRNFLAKPSLHCMSYLDRRYHKRPAKDHRWDCPGLRPPPFHHHSGCGICRLRANGAIGWWHHPIILTNTQQV